MGDAMTGPRDAEAVVKALPTRGNVHEIARESQPDARVVYVDNDPMVAVTRGRWSPPTSAPPSSRPTCAIRTRCWGTRRSTG
ncbi:SAM-dependent methyltransferase [Actinomadura madurae]|nr:SAM-dependent methyltransferase [Actinomadura madurae]MCQ0006806.1 SAM-dependent methyltransferase [Actinomadura madurae]